jgi:intron-binding protein aquarius
LGFSYDTIIIEEAGQILEIESFVPLVLQEKEKSNLKRVTLIGDHFQLPPIVQHRGIAKYGNLEQSMFSRLFRLGVPHVVLDAQV